MIVVKYPHRYTVDFAYTPVPPAPIRRTTRELADEMPRAMRLRIRNAIASRDGWALLPDQIARLEEFVGWLLGCSIAEKDSPELADGLAVLVESTITTQAVVDAFLAAWPEA